MTLWLKVSLDRYSYPEIIADSLEELAEKCGTTKQTIRSTMCHYKAGRLKQERYVKVEVDDE